MLCTTCKSIDRKASCIAEKVKDIASTSYRTYKRTVVSLIKEETCLLALSPVDDELVAVLEHGLLIILESFATIHISVDKIESRLERSCPRTLVIYSLQI